MSKFLAFFLLWIMGMSYLAAQNDAPVLKGRYDYPYNGAHLHCIDGVTWLKGAVNSKLDATCELVDERTHKTVFTTIQPDVVVFIVELE